MNDSLRHRPPERTPCWVTEPVGAGSRIRSLRRLTGGGWHANHSLTVIDRHGGAHMRWNLALTHPLGAADTFLRLHRSLSSDPSADQHYWNLVTDLDLIFDLNPDDWPRFDLGRLERYVESVLAQAP
ncbi:MAG: hypothetical protein M3305_04820 [Actinomycetota bacterium]|nr:hypothetical protein [Actinomycetota bacterium]